MDGADAATEDDALGRMRSALRRLLLALLPAAIASNAVASYDFWARESDELSVRRGDVLTLLPGGEPEEGWALVRRADGREGLVPLNYMRVDAAVEPSGVVHGGEGAAAAAAAAATSVAAAAAADADADEDEDDDDDAERQLREAMRVYRNRRAAHNVGEPDAARLRRWGVTLDTSAPTAAASPIPAADTQEHRSGVYGVPFFNLIGEYIGEAELAAAIVQMLRDEWLPPAKADAGASPGVAPRLAGLDAALRSAAGPDSNDVILTFANLGYADFVLNGFGNATRAPHTLVIALDKEAHELLSGAGIASFFDAEMPTMEAEQADHRSATFMDIMKLRLLYLAEVLLRGYNALLTDADAVFLSSPFEEFSKEPHITVACDSTVVPRSWAGVCISPDLP